MDIITSSVPRIIENYDCEVGIMRPRRNSLNNTLTLNDEEVQRRSKMRSIRKTLTRTWSKRVRLRSKSNEVRSATNTSPTKAPKPEETLWRTSARTPGRRRALSAGPSGKGLNSNTCAPETIETVALRPLDSHSPTKEPETIAQTSPVNIKQQFAKDDVAVALEDVKQYLDPALLNGSSSNFGGAGAARSAPSTPQTSIAETPLLSTAAGVPGECNPGTTPPSSLPRSPSHTIFTKTDKTGNLKQLSSSAPAMTAQAPSPEPSSPKSGSTTKDWKVIPYKAKQKKFHRHFPSALQDDVLNYYSCALISDILLQGHLYITKNYFAFYSNVFGYVTKLLIPMQSVQVITKERTARIIPNAVGITTCEDKHVFGSLMSRDATFKFMNVIWEAAKKEQFDSIIPPPPDNMENASDLSESSETREESGRESASEITRFRKCANQPNDVYNSTENKMDMNKNNEDKSGFREAYLKFIFSDPQNLLLYITTFILIILFLSAAVLLYRIGQVQNRYTHALQDNFVPSDNEDVYGELLHWQTHLHSKSAGAVHSFIDNNLDQIAKVRKSLEALSTLLIPKGENGVRQTSTANPIDAENS